MAAVSYTSTWAGATVPIQGKHILLCQRSAAWIYAELHYARRFTDTELADFWKSGKGIPEDKYRIVLYLLPAAHERGTLPDLFTV
ncbi:MAG: hypothetical protein G01um101448_970 [Parcubacteria group bacterium Gr01-1014_48]|nr:MAG: hypothetical protein Greene041614_580 [Parcubacteria group bacterium Greene0416_14]TSC72541.1 MAG: hypothetical protein G01um101448_970 [Parcubacteria group bacterium Gr01-1014_48]TSD00596.1 MAG: hypothetical protein Greene101415_817 [Parcubacteria group bacterium Greene1014_15]TSD08286.1 MAG: hypothetical protein Greene07144_268 [Parcubacteria group bacterium Greene0714_4]